MSREVGRYYQDGYRSWEVLPSWMSSWEALPRGVVKLGGTTKMSREVTWHEYVFSRHTFSICSVSDQAIRELIHFPLVFCFSLLVFFLFFSFVVFFLFL